MHVSQPENIADLVFLDHAVSQSFQHVCRIKIMMADAAAARREIRRRRILENIDKRLQLISGKSDECLKEPPIRCSVSVPDQNKIRFPVPDQKSEVSVSPSTSGSCLSSISNGVLVTEPESRALLSPSFDFVAAGDDEVANDLPILEGLGIPIPEPLQATSHWEKFLNHKYDVVLFSLLIQIYSLLFTFDNAYFFLPLIIYTATKLIWIPTQRKSSIADIFLLLNGVSANRTHKIMSTMQWLSAIAQDVCIYLFTTVCIQSLITLIT